MQPSFGSGSTDSPMRGTCACWPTPDADLSCGSQSFGDNRSSTTQILNYLPSCPVDPWNSVIRATTNDRDFWKEELEDKVVDFRNVSRCIDRITRANHDRSRSRTRPGTKEERGREGGAHPMRGQDGRYRTTPTGIQQGCGWMRHCLPHEPRTYLRVLPGATQNCRVSSAPRLDSTSQRCGEGQGQEQVQEQVLPSDQWTHVWSQ